MHVLLLTVLAIPVLSIFAENCVPVGFSKS